MILDSENSHYTCIGIYCADDTLIHNGKKFKNSKKETILVATIDNKLTFDSHINRMCKKASQTLSVLS